MDPIELYLKQRLGTVSYRVTQPFHAFSAAGVASLKTTGRESVKFYIVFAISITIQPAAGLFTIADDKGMKILQALNIIEFSDTHNILHLIEADSPTISCSNTNHVFTVHYYGIQTI